MPDAAFAPTRWSIVLAARGTHDAPAMQRALGELCQLYWFPLYSFARRQGCSPHDAEDATQQFLAEVASGDVLAQADPVLGKLRTFLLAAFQHDLADARKAAGRRKRGGGQVIVSLDWMAAEERLTAEPSDESSPELHFEREWAVAVLEAAVSRVETEYVTVDRTEVFATLRPYLTAHEVDYAHICQQLGYTPANARQAMHRLRERFRRALRAEVADTLREPTEETVNAELQALRAVLAK